MKAKYKRISDPIRGNVREHVLIAEKILGRRLKKGECVHHVDGNGFNNDHSNLVICGNDAYHHLLHRRTRALEESGNANNIYCKICGKYDSAENIVTSGVKGYSRYHKECKQLQSRQRYISKRIEGPRGFYKSKFD